MEPAPQVYKTPITPLSASSSWKKRLPFIFLGILGVVILIELIWGFNTFFGQKKISQKTLQEQINNISTPQLIASPSKPSFSKNDNVAVTIKVVTGGNQTDSTDILIHFDPAFLEASGSGFVDIGKIYPEYPVANFDNVRGIVQISGTSLNSEQSFSGIGTFATLNFKAKKAGSTEVRLDYQPGSTADSNVVLAGTAKDILASVTNADIIITDSSSVTQNSPDKASCSGYYQYCQLQGKTGKQFCQKGVLNGSECKFDPVLTVSCSECLVQ